MDAVKCVVEEYRVERMRAKAAAWLLDLRSAAEITAAEAAEQAGVDTTDMAAFEAGRMPVPPALYEDFARIFGIDPKDFAKTCLMYNNPSAYEALFGALPAESREAA